MTVPVGFFDPSTIVPGFESLGHYLPQIDAEALRMLTRYVAAPQHEIYVANVGTFTGSSAAIIANAARMHDSAASIYCVDTWRGSSAGDRINEIYSTQDVLAAFHRNFATHPLGHGSRLMPIRSTSLDAAQSTLCDRAFDLVFIDADHSYEAVKADIAAWEPKVREGGILCFHDYGVFPGVTRALNEWGFCGLIGSVAFRIKGLD